MNHYTPPPMFKETPPHHNAYKNGLLIVALPCILSFAPGLGILMLLAAPLAIILGIILAIVAMAKGGAVQGIALFLFSVAVAPVVMFMGSLFSASLLLDDATADSAHEEVASPEKGVSK